MYGIRADELDMHSIIAESIIGFLLQHTGIMIQRQDISMNSSVCACLMMAWLWMICLPMSKRLSS